MSTPIVPISKNIVLTSPVVLSRVTRVKAQVTLKFPSSSINLFSLFSCRMFNVEKPFFYWCKFHVGGIFTLSHWLIINIA